MLSVCYSAGFRSLFVWHGLRLLDKFMASLNKPVPKLVGTFVCLRVFVQGNAVGLLIAL